MTHQSLFNDLMALCADSDTFYYVDRVRNGETYRIFNYRLSSWTEMQKPNALNCRGTTFLLVGGSQWWLVSFTPEKFFNLEEGGVEHTPHRIGCVMDKRDGSLISTVELLNNQFFLKSKASFDSDQAKAAETWIRDPRNSEFFASVYSWIRFGYTVNMEWTAPDNRIVVPYQESKLTILNVRSYLRDSNDFGETYYGDDLRRLADHYGINYQEQHYVDFETLDSMDHSMFADMKAETEGEGYVVEIQHPEGSYLVKVKNDKYLTLHRTKDSVNTPTKLFEAIIMESGDDLRSLFHDDPYSLDLIQKMEDYVVPKFNHVIHMVEDFHNSWKDQDRKTYAIAAQKQYPDFMSLCMNLYLGRENDYKAFALKHVEDIFGVTNVKKEVSE